MHDLSCGSEGLMCGCHCVHASEMCCWTIWTTENRFKRDTRLLVLYNASWKVYSCKHLNDCVCGMCKWLCTLIYVSVYTQSSNSKSINSLCLGRQCCDLRRTYFIRPQTSVRIILKLYYRFVIHWLPSFHCGKETFVYLGLLSWSSEFGCVSSNFSLSCGFRGHSDVWCHVSLLVKVALQHHFY